ncbi:MAG: ABC transporter ATP-binding protein [Elusimicrobia bacterium RIFOXYA2_FULL_40_6]|nr:MAG: ABC transporter ATP-binding protein [Elusimicrobia bacterium RIFOXYA2_FULL_40_6]
MIHIINLTKYFGNQILYDDITLGINPREKIGLVGRNGHGKTTLFNLILDKIQPDSGEISIPKGYRIGHLEQHMNFTQDSVLKEACLGLREEDTYSTWKVEKILSGLGFSKEDMQKPCSVFSGGFQIRLNLTKVLVSEPNMLMLDEPNNYLDIVASRWLISFLQQWQGELILITHDRGFMDSVTTHTVAIHRTKVKKVKGNTQKLYDQIATEEEVYEKTLVNEENKRRQLEVFIARFRAKASLASQVQSKMKLLEKMGENEHLERIESLNFSFNSIPFISTHMVNANEITFSYTGSEPYLIKDFSLTVGKKERICVIGKNGKGKSTLLKTFAGEIQPLSGTIKINQTLQAGYFGQPNILRLNPKNTVLDEIMLSNPACNLQTARNIAGMFMFKRDDAFKPVSVLSGGEKNRVMMAKIVVTPCQMLLLDEPTNHLDMDSCDALLKAIDEFDGSVVMVTHDEAFLKRIAKRLVIFDKEKITLYEGGYQDFLENIGWDDERNLDPESQPKKVSLSLNNTFHNKKTYRKLKAEIMKDRDNVLRPLKTEINKLEKDISEMEQEINVNNELLIKASAEGYSPKIAETSKRNSYLKQEIEVSFEKLTKYSAEYEANQKDFEEKLKRLQSL